MHERPIGDLVASLNNIGAKIEYAKISGFPPLIIHPSKMIKQKIDIGGEVSSQFLTSLLIASPIFSKNKELEIRVNGPLISKPYVKITLQLLKLFGLKVLERKDNDYLIPMEEIMDGDIEFNVEDGKHIMTIKKN